MAAFDVGTRLAEVRDKAGLTQEQLSNKSGVSRKHISAVENGASAPTVDLLAALIKECDSSLPEFFESRLIRRYPNPDHEDLHEKLQAVLESKDKKLAATAETMIIALYNATKPKK